MSKLHVLTSDGKGRYSAVVHTPVPLGNNSAGESWKAALLAGGASGSTDLVVGTGPSNILQAEKDQITAGNVLEFRISFPFESGGASLVSLNEMVDSAIVNKKAQLASQYKYFGFTVA